VRILIGAAAVLLLVAVVSAVVFLGDEEDGSGQVADVRLEGDEPGVRGVAHFEQDGEEMTGYVVVWGLEPNSEHAVHFHGPDSSCGTKADPVAVHPDLQADGNGVAFTEVDLSADRPLLDGGFYYNVHEGSSRLAENPEIACGDLGPTGSGATAP
jgi:hypothetical protein